MPASSDGWTSTRPGASAIGCVIAALGLALVVIPAAGPQSAWTLWLYLSGAGAVVLGSAIVALDVRKSIAAAGSLAKDEQRRFFGQVLFDRHATNLAFFFMVVVLLVSIVTTMMLYNGQLAVTARDFAAQLSTAASPVANGKGKVLAIVLLLSIALSWCGAGLYVVQRLEIKRDDPGEFFNFMEFFRGIWSRVGQANLYTLLFFLLIWANGEAVGSDRVPGGTNPAVAWDIVKSYAWLPILGLLSGLLVKSAESVVFGLGTRILAGVSAFLGSDGTGSAGGSSKSGRDGTTPPPTKGGDDASKKTLPAPVADATPAKAPSASEPAKASAPVMPEPATKPAPLPAPPPAMTSSVIAPTGAKPTTNGTYANGNVPAASPATTPTTSTAPNLSASSASTPNASTNGAGTFKRESPIVSPFGSSFSVPTSVPANPPTTLPLPSSSGSMSMSSANSNTNGWGTLPIRVVPVAAPAPAIIDVKPTIVPVAAPTATSVMVNVERPDVPTLQDVVGPATNSRPQSSTTGIPQSSMWPALIRVVAPSRMTPNEPKILLPDLPEAE